MRGRHRVQSAESCMGETDTIPSLEDEEAWQSVRQTANSEGYDPVRDVASEAIRCYEWEPGAAAPASATAAVEAGGQITFDVDPSLPHQGALGAYMARAPEAAADFDGAGPVWSKVFQNHPTDVNGELRFPLVGTWREYHLRLFLDLALLLAADLLPPSQCLVRGLGSSRERPHRNILVIQDDLIILPIQTS